MPMASPQHYSSRHYFAPQDIDVGFVAAETAQGNSREHSVVSYMRRSEWDFYLPDIRGVSKNEREGLV